MRNGFLARTGIPFGLLSMTRGLGGFGTQPIAVETVHEGETVTGKSGPRAVPENRHAPHALVYKPGAKKKRGC